ncbi:hypothetical protein M5K25_001574 [Dendrobium thyrsiflorum]|uniref:Uncharacterized protein n=1 Tax=Dendrobium thyrsiflorum TaxID=117978 RepID=A0ABD0VS61_DENTH
MDEKGREKWMKSDLQLVMIKKEIYEHQHQWNKLNPYTMISSAVHNKAEYAWEVSSSALDAVTRLLNLRDSDCMGDPNVDHDFYYDDQGRVDVLHSPFFDVAFGNDTTTDEYMERILYQLTLAIEDQLPASRWCLVSRRPSSPNPATSTRGIPLLLVASLLCMGDPNVDHDFYYDDQGRVDVLRSPFFDVAFENDTTADEYVERILYQLTLAIEDQLPASRWCLVSRRPSSPNPATSPATSTRGIPLLLVASLLVASLLLRPFA